ncbi:MAG: gliding motility lipoprotein GldD [Reichenbachiella sp.]
MKGIVFLILAITLSCCGQRTLVPKPKGYNKILLPPAEYVLLPDSFPYQFEYSKFSKVYGDTTGVSERFWIDLYYPSLDANIQVTYKPVNNDRETLEEYLKDSYTLTAKHNIKAYAIDESVVTLKNGMKATLMELTGEVPSQFQYHVTDSSMHFLRCALYFKTSVKNDSLQPVINYVKEDMVHMLNTLQWNN